MQHDEIRRLLHERPDLRRKLYCRGFFMTNDPVDPKAHPFYGSWQEYRKFGFQILVHPQQNAYLFSGLVLIGHAYDPISMKTDENQILKEMDASDSIFPILNRLTGIFTLLRISQQSVELLADASGMQTTFYGIINGNIYVSTHEMLLGELLNLPRDPYIMQLIRYRYFHLFGIAFPGDLTQFSEIKRLTPNVSVLLQDGKEETRRFYTPRSLQIDREEIVQRVSALLQSNMELIVRKWDRPAISLTGGCDSRTTLACTNGQYDRFLLYSFVSSESEAVDAEAAQEICRNLGLPHTIYRIPDRDELVEDVEETRIILQWNKGDILPPNPNDARKQAFFSLIDDFDVEVKSWASEIGRAYYSKRFHGRTNFGGKPTPRACTSLYKVFAHNRKLVKQTDKVFEDFLQRLFIQDSKNPLPWQEQFFWEYRVPAWNGRVITGEHRFSREITIPYNNRLMLELLLSASIEDRIEDRIYEMIRRNMDQRIDETGISVTNLKHTKRREMLENLYYSVHTSLPWL